MSNYKNRVKETSTTTGTGDLTLAGAVTGFQTFNAAFATNKQFEYAIEPQTANGEWEAGEGYLSGASTLVRARPLTGSAGDNTLVTFSAGTKNVFATLNAYGARRRDTRNKSINASRCNWWT